MDVYEINNQDIDSKYKLEPDTIILGLKIRFVIYLFNKETRHQYMLYT